MSMWLVMCVMGLSLAVGGAAMAEQPYEKAEGFEVVNVQRIWDRAPHNGFPDLIRWNGQWYCSLREGEGHVSGDGIIRIITSEDGESWRTAAVFEAEQEDLREVKFAEMPDGRLMAIGATADFSTGARGLHRSWVWITEDGENWTERKQVGDPEFWMWRAIWHEGKAYSFGYRTGEPFFIRLYRSSNAVNWDMHADEVFTEGLPNETAMLVLDDGRMLCLLRRDRDTTTAQLGIAEPPYTDWQWTDLGKRIGGPALVKLPNGQVVAPIRLLNPMRTTICVIDVEAGTLREVLTLPSGGDGGYTGAVLHDELLWVAYYSSHEQQKASIYLAKIRIPAD